MSSLSSINFNDKKQIIFIKVCFNIVLPMTYMSPYIDSQKHMRIIEKTLIEIFDKLKIRHGQYNIEAYFNKDDFLFIIEINARQGGHGLLR